MTQVHKYNISQKPVLYVARDVMRAGITGTVLYCGVVHSRKKVRRSVFGELLTKLDLGAELLRASLCLLE